MDGVVSKLFLNGLIYNLPYGLICRLMCGLISGLNSGLTHGLAPRVVRYSPLTTHLSRPHLLWMGWAVPTYDILTLQWLRQYAGCSDRQ